MKVFIVKVEPQSAFEFGLGVIPTFTVVAQRRENVRRVVLQALDVTDPAAQPLRWLVEHDHVQIEEIALDREQAW